MTPTQLAIKMNACEDGVQWLDSMQMSPRELWERVRNPEHTLWYSRKKFKGKARDAAYREFCRLAIENYSHLVSGQSSNEVARFIREADVQGEAAYSAAAVYCVAKAMEESKRRSAWAAARSVSNWLTVAAICVAALNPENEYARYASATKAVLYERVVESKILHDLFEGSFTVTEPDLLGTLASE